MSEPTRPRIYLITPPEVDLGSFAPLLASVLDQNDVACVRLALSSQDQDQIAAAADALREVTSVRDVALVVQAHVMMVKRLGLDGVHLLDGARSVRKVRAELGRDAIVGAFCATSRHDAINAAEAGADYVSFGPVAASGLGDGAVAGAALFSWWSEMIEVPVVAEGGLNEDTLTTLSDKTDFFALGPEIWGADDPAAHLASLIKVIGS